MMAAIRVYLDEDVRPLLAEVLRQRGYDAVSSIELGRMQVADADHFEYAARDDRAILTFNLRDFIPLAKTSIQSGRRFAGLVVSEQLPFRVLLHRVLRLLGTRQSDEVANRIVWLSDFAR